ncbi:MAG: ATP:cob(I)alamin adenosyltransferase [Bradymonadaceae bacterium]
MLATRPEDVGEEMPRLTETDVEALEAEIDRFNEDLPELRSFVLPGGSRVNVELHRARTLCRRAERAAVTVAEQTEVPGTPLAYLNRLGDALFVWSRWAARQASDADEVLWDPNLSSSGSTEDGADS